MPALQSNVGVVIRCYKNRKTVSWTSILLSVLPLTSFLCGVTVVFKRAEESLEGSANRTVTEGLGGTEVVSQHPVIPFKKLCPLDMRAQPPKLLDLQGKRIERASHRSTLAWHFRRQHT